MRELYPFFRLAARPSVLLGWFWAVWMFCSLPLLILLEGPVSVLEVTNPDQLSPDQWRALWQTVLLFPATGGVVGALLSAVALSAPWSWTLPSARTRFVKGLAVLAAILCLPMPLLLARMNAGAAAIASFGVGAFAFGATALVFGRMLMRWESRAAALAMAVAVWQADSMAALATAHPWLVTIVALDGAALWLYLGYSSKSVRQLIALSSPQRWWQRKRTGASERAPLWTRPLAGGRIADWVLAASYESWGSRSRFAWLQAAMVLVFLGTLASLYSIGEVPADTGDVAAYALGFQVASIVPLAFAALPPILRVDRVYPLSRRRRAVVTWCGSLAATIAFGLMAISCLVILGWVIPLLPWWTAGPLPLAVLLAYLPHGLVWLPVLFWVHTRYVRVNRVMMTRGAIGPSPERGGKPMMVGLVLFVTATMGTHGLLAESALLHTALQRIISVVALAVLVQLAYWLLLRRHFATGDLV